MCSAGGKGRCQTRRNFGLNLLFGRELPKLPRCYGTYVWTTAFFFPGEILPEKEMKD
jgi:hypothetical protein